MTKTLRLADLRLACERLLREAESEFGPEVSLDSLPFDEYWCFQAITSPASLEDPHRPMGTLSDDVDSLGELLARPHDEIYLWHDLAHVCGLLGFLAFLDSPDGSPKSQA